MKCHILFSRKDKKNIMNLSSVELARVVKVKQNTCNRKSQLLKQIGWFVYVLAVFVVFSELYS